VPISGGTRCWLARAVARSSRISRAPSAGRRGWRSTRAVDVPQPQLSTWPGVRGRRAEFMSSSAARFHSLADVDRFNPRSSSRASGPTAPRPPRSARWCPSGSACSPCRPGCRTPDPHGARARLPDHAVLCYLVLATVFYVPRFRLCLLPVHRPASRYCDLDRAFPRTARSRPGDSGVVPVAPDRGALGRVREPAHDARERAHGARRACVQSIGRPASARCRANRDSLLPGMDFVAMPLAFDLPIWCAWPGQPRRLPILLGARALDPAHSSRCSPTR
jgi:hypothetical protein